MFHLSSLLTFPLREKSSIKVINLSQRFQPHQRNPAGCSSLICGIGRVNFLNHVSPGTYALAILKLTPSASIAYLPHLEINIRPVYQVEKPSGMFVGPELGSDDDKCAFQRAIGKRR